MNINILTCTLPYWLSIRNYIKNRISSWKNKLVLNVFQKHWYFKVSVAIFYFSTIFQFFQHTDLTRYRSISSFQNTHTLEPLYMLVLGFTAGVILGFFQLHKIHSNKVELSFEKLEDPKMVCQMIQTGQSPSKSSLSNLSDVSFVFRHLSTGSVAY